MMDSAVLAQVLRRVADDLQTATGKRAAMRTYPPTAVDEDSVQYAIASALHDVADQLKRREDARKLLERVMSAVVIRQGQLRFVWDWGHSVRVEKPSGEQVALLFCGNPLDEAVTLDEAHEAVDRYCKDNGL